MPDAALEQTIDASDSQGVAQQNASASDAAPSRVAIRQNSSTRLTEDLLQSRLRTASIVLGAGLTFFLIRSALQFLRAPNGLTLAMLATHITAALTAIVIAVRLCLDCELLRRHLRAAEVMLFGTSAVYFLVISIFMLLRSGETGILLPFQQTWLLLIFTYALYIPNTGRRAGAVIGSMALVPALLIWTVPALAPAVGRVIYPNPEYRQLLYMIPSLMAFASLIAIWGAARMGSLRTEAYAARQLGQYQLKQRIGAGGMGEVFLAEHLLLKRPCAIKLIHPDRGQDETTVLRFEREVKAMSRLSHWNTVEVFDYGIAEDGTFYYVMEYLPGLSLQRLVEMFGALPASRVVYFLKQVCAALNEAHGQGVVHRDIKPANIFAAFRGGEHDVVKLLDFGLAKPAGELAGDVELTLEGSITGSPYYMSPEQATGDTAPDARTDIYSLGAVAYYLLTGTPPFIGDSVLKVIAAHIHQAPAPPSELARVPEDVETIVLRCLAKSPDDRYADIMSLRHALEACDVTGDWSAASAEVWWREHGCPAKRALDESVLGV